MAQFDGQPGETFAGYYDTVRGAIRERLVQENLEPYLVGRPEEQAALDIGGGDGRDAAWLALKGYEVTMVEPSEDMLVRAESRFQEEGVDVRTIQTDGAAAREILADQRFDVILSHGVLMYLPEPQVHVNELSGLLAEDGVISLLTKGFEGAAHRFMARGDHEALDRLSEDGQFMTNNGVEATAYQPEEVMAMFTRLEMTILDWFGVRVEYDEDRRLLSEVSPREMRHIMHTERFLGSAAGAKSRGQMLQFIAARL